jgi:hypothetical protein
MKLFNFFIAKPSSEPDDPKAYVQVKKKANIANPWMVSVTSSDRAITVYVHRAKEPSYWGPWKKVIWAGKSWTERRYKKAITKAKQVAADFNERDRQVKRLREETQKMLDKAAET